ncbi:MAG: protein kinase [Bacteroidota bacterium]
MLSRAELQKLPLRRLLQLAEEHAIPNLDELDHAQLIERLHQFFATQGLQEKTEVYTNSTENDRTEVYSQTEDAGDQTEAYQLEDTDRTEAYTDSAAEDTTEAYNLENTSGSPKSDRHKLGPGDSILLNEKRYKILSIISEGSGEAVIYLVENEKGEEKVLKLYFEFANYKLEPNPQALSRIQKIQDADILRLWDFGTNDQKYEGKYCFEISDLARGGDLLKVGSLQKKYTPDFVRQHVVPEIFKGIQRLHRHKIFHCDLKPQNVFYLDEAQTDLVIGDYGSAKTLDEEIDQEAWQTSLAKGTATYRAPEQSNLIINNKNDYYSFGIILVHLVYPELLFVSKKGEKLDREKLSKVIRRLYRHRPIMDSWDLAYGNINDLIAGLTLYDHETRWGEQEVSDWLAGKTVKIRYQQDTHIKPIKLSAKVVIENETDLLRFMGEEENWHERLILDTPTYTSMLDFINSARDAEQRKEFQDIIKFYKKSYEYTKGAIVRFFRPRASLDYDGLEINLWQSENIEADVVRWISKLDEKWRTTPLEGIRFQLFRLELALRQLEKDLEGDAASQLLVHEILEGIGAALKSDTQQQTSGRGFAFFHSRLDPSERRIRSSQKLLLNLFYDFVPDRSFRTQEGKYITTLKEVCLHLAQSPEQFTDLHESLEREMFLEKNQLSGYSNFDYRDLMFTVFQAEMNNEIRIKDVQINPNRSFDVQYHTTRSLSPFLKDHQITQTLEDADPNIHTMKLEGNLFGGSGAMLYTHFQRGLKNTHGIILKSLRKENQKEIQSRLTLASIGQNIQLHIAEIMASVAISILFLFYLWVPEFIEATNLNNYVNYSESALSTTSFWTLGLLFAVPVIIAIAVNLFYPRQGYFLSEKSGNGYFTLDTTTITLVGVALVAFPILMGLTNWLWELLADVVLVIAGGAFLIGFSDSSESDPPSWKPITVLGGAIILVGLAIARFFSMFGSGNERGWYDLIAFCAIYGLGFGVPIIGEAVTKLNWIQVILKTLAATLILWIFAASIMFVFSWFNAEPQPEENPQNSSVEDTRTMNPTTGQQSQLTNPQLAQLNPGFTPTQIAVINDPDGYTNIRSKPNSNSHILGKIYTGQEFLARPYNNKWHKVHSQIGIEGFMFSQLVRPVRAYSSTF